MISPCTWTSAVGVLNELLPGCDSFLPDAIAAAAEKSGHSVVFLPLPEWESMPDTDIIALLISVDLRDDERLIVVTEASWFKKVGPLEMVGSDLSGFLANHWSTYGEFAVDGDLVLVLLDRKSICIFHHEGFYCTLKLASPSATGRIGKTLNQ